ncbi:MAG: acetyltransferase [Gemmatimonadetes bacterium]|nr:acetyltransferase [Gemmatimonadota bacterium]
MRVVLYGASELGRDVASMAPALRQAGAAHEIVGFLDDGEGAAGRIFLDLPVLGGGDWLEGAGDDVAVVVTVGDPAVRRRLVGGLEARGARFATLVHPSAVVTPWVSLGEGSVIMAGCTFTAEVEVGVHVMVNPGCTLAHDVVVGDFAYLSPGVDLAGRAVVEEEAHLGTGAVVIPGRRVGARSVVGAGAVVVRDVPADVTVAGVPARILREHRPPTRRV